MYSADDIAALGCEKVGHCKFLIFLVRDKFKNTEGLYDKHPARVFFALYEKKNMILYKK